MILAVEAKVLRDVVDLLGEQGNLNLGGAGVRFVVLETLDDLLFSLYREHSAGLAFPRAIFRRSFQKFIMRALDPATAIARRVTIVTDSAACLSAEDQAASAAIVVPLTVILDGEPFDDGALDSDRFYERLRGAGTPPKTAGVSPAAFLAAFRSAPAPSVLCVTVSSRFSGTYANALLAAADAAREGREVSVVDSRYAAMAEGYVALAAARAAQAGKALDDVRRQAEAVIPEVGLVMALQGLEHLARGGRVPRAAAWATSLLKLQPLVEFRNREIRLAGRARTRPHTLEALVDLLTRRVEGAARIHLTVHHAAAEADAKWLYRAAVDRLHPASININEFTQVMTAHVGPGLVGFAYRVER